MSHKAFPTCLPREHPRRKRMSRSPSMDGRFLDVKGFLNQVSSSYSLSRVFFQSRTSSWLREREKEKKVLKRRKTRGGGEARKGNISFPLLRSPLRRSRRRQARFPEPPEPWTRSKKRGYRPIKLFDFLFFNRRRGSLSSLCQCPFSTLSLVRSSIS